MPDMAQLERELMSRHPESWVRYHLASFPHEYFQVFERPELSRHLELLQGLSDDRPVAIDAESEPGGVWKVVVVGYDAFQFLSTLCTLLAVRGLSILEGRVFTSQPPPPEPTTPAQRRATPPRRVPRTAPTAGPDRRARIVDVFRVRPVHGQSGPPDWDAFEDELVDLTRLLRVDKYGEVRHRLIRRFVAALGPYQPEIEGLAPIDLSLNAHGSETGTEVRIRVCDSFGFLSLTSSALAVCGIRIVQAEIRTREDRVDDILWVTDRWGHKITSEPKLRELRLSLILIEHFSSRLPRATDPEAALVHFCRFATETMAGPDWAEEFEALEKPEVLDALVRVLGESHFLWEDYLHAQPENILPMICDPAEWIRLPGPKQLSAGLHQALTVAETPESRTLAIRRFRDREVFRADVRSILGLSRDAEQFSVELTDVAEVVLNGVLALAIEETRSRRSLHVPDPLPPFALFALGKFGGRELGFASDLEVLLVYDDRAPLMSEAETGTGSFFDSIAAAMRGVLGSREGHAFDLDFRLRPYGRAGSPASSLSTFLDYYRAGGAAWGYERQALIKLRFIAGDPALGRTVEAHRDRFVFGPEPFDLEGLRKMRRLQTEQLVQPGTINAKYSPGALVDVEYLVQALQITHGSQDPTLRSPNTLQALEALGSAGRLAPDQVFTLRSGYQFFRSLIDSLRVVRDHAKDLAVPAFGTDELALLARRMRAAGPESLQAELGLKLEATRSLTACLESLLTPRR